MEFFMKKIDYYQCDFCNEEDVKQNIEKHEKECNSDPSKKRCDSCEHGLTHTWLMGCILQKSAR